MNSRQNLNLTPTLLTEKTVAACLLKDDTVHNDMPAMLSVGVDYDLLEKLTVSAGFHYYWDKGANYGKSLDATPDVMSTTTK